MIAATVTMLDTRTNEWLSRLQAKGPRLVSLVLAALIAAQLAQIAMILLVKPVKSPQPVLTGSVPHTERPSLHIQSVISAHLFGIAAVVGAQDPANAPQSSANLLLAGTIATQDPKHGVAIISDGGGPSKVYSVGDRVGGAMGAGPEWILGEAGDPGRDRLRGRPGGGRRRLGSDRRQGLRGLAVDRDHGENSGGCSLHGGGS